MPVMVRSCVLAQPCGSLLRMRYVATWAARDRLPMDTATSAEVALYALNTLHKEVESTQRLASSGPAVDADEVEAKNNAIARVSAAHRLLSGSPIIIGAASAERQDAHPACGDAILDAAGKAWADQVRSIWPDLDEGTTLAEDAAKLSVDDALAAARRGVPEWLSTRAEWPMVLDAHLSTSSADIAVLTARVDGAFTAMVELSSVAAREASKGAAWIPCRVAMGASDEPFPLGARTLSAHLVYRDLSTRAGALLVAIDALAPSQRLPWLMRYLSSLHNIFISPCRACAHILRPSTLGPSTLLPATSRSPKLEPYHAACYLQVR